MMPDGQPQSSLVWCDYDGKTVQVNTTRQRQKSKNMASNPKVSLLVIDTNDDGRWIEVRGEVTISEKGALEHLDDITGLYTEHPCYYGHVFPQEQRDKETRIICHIKPTKVNLDAIHK
jgi:PPOX class probable F420-dependent enzyme